MVHNAPECSAPKAREAVTLYSVVYELSSSYYRTTDSANSSNNGCSNVPKKAEHPIVVVVTEPGSIVIIIPTQPTSIIIIL